MKKTVLLLLMALLTVQAIHAQFNYEKKVRYGLFNHLGLGLSAGTDGIGIDVASPVTSFVALRAGVSVWPKVSYKTNIDIHDANPELTDNVDVKGTMNMFNFKALADIYPFRNSSFHITGGVFIGNDDVVNAKNTSMFIKNPKKYGKLGLKLGDRRITTDGNGYLHADVTANQVKPYLGIGFGRAVPTKSRVSVSCDFGVQFWGTPRLGAMTVDDWGEETYHKFTYKELDEYDDEDLKDAMKTGEKIHVFPVLNIRISGRIF